MRGPVREERKLAAYLKHVLPVFLAACLVTVALIPVYITTKRQASARVTQAVSAQLEAGIASVNRKINVLNTLVYSFCLDSDTLSLALLSDEQLSRQNYLALYHMRYRLSAITRMDLMGQHVIVQFRSNSVLLMDDRLFNDKTQVYGSFLTYAGKSYTQWQTALFDETAGAWPVQRSSILSNDTEAMLLEEDSFLTLIFRRRPHLSSSIVTSILLPIDRLYQEIMPGYNPQECLLVVADSEGKVLWDATDGQGPAVLLAREGTPLRLEDGEYVAFGCTPGVGLSAGVAISQRLLYADVAQVMRMIYLFIVIALTCATLYCAVYAYIYFRPMLSLMDRLSDLGYSKGGDGRLYESLQAALTSLSSDRELLCRQVDEAAGRAQAYALQRAASGAGLTAAEQEILSRKPVFSDRYIVAILEYHAGSEEERRSFLAKAEAILSFQSGMEDVMEESRLLCIYAYQDGSIEEGLDTAFGVLSQSAEGRVNMAVSAVHGDVESMPEAVRQAEETLPRARLAVKPGVTWYEEGADRISGAVIPFARYAELSACLVAGDKAGAHEIIGSVREAAQAGQLSPEHTVRAIGNLRDAVSLAAVRMGEAIPSAPLSEEKAPWRALNQLDEWADALCDCVDRSQESRSEEQVRQIMDYMGAHYTQADFSLTHIAEEFNLSEKYLSRLIKKQTGENYSAHIENLRMEHAKRLLSTTRMTVDEIAQSVGYEHKNTFYKAFKRHYGCVPNDLRGGEGG